MMPSNQQVKENSKGDGDCSMAGYTITTTIIQVATNTYIGWDKTWDLNLNVLYVLKVALHA